MGEEDEDTGPPEGEQYAFSDAHNLTKQLLAQGYPAADIAEGLLVAALSAFRKVLPDTEISKRLYEFADDYATRYLGR